jgi:phosphatidylethanolamine/phosphatidyl-N-methylethanolamine N-methyltransferase
VSTVKSRVLGCDETSEENAKRGFHRANGSGPPNAYLFFRESMRSLRLTASVFPSSRSLANALARPIDFQSARTVVELGPGTGAITRQILKRMRPDGRLFAIDIVPTFIDHLQATCHDPRLILLRGSATDLQSLLAPHDVQSVDAVVSSLPLTAMDEGTRTQIMHQIGECLVPDGTLTQCQWEIARLRRGRFREERFLRGFFGDVSVGRVILNLPPTLVFTCRRWQRPVRSLR